MEEPFSLNSSSCRKVQYSPEPFFDAKDLSASANAYEQLKAPHPLAGEAQKKITQRLVRSPKVSRVLDPGSHSSTEADLTLPMAQDCLKELQEIDGTVRNELRRLHDLREQSIRARAIVTNVDPFPTLSTKVCWRNQMKLPLVGAAAARSHGWTVDFSQLAGTVGLAPGAIIQVAGESLEPVARFGQWVLLAEEGCSIHDGDLVAVCVDRQGSFLRRAWSNNRDWFLQSINPVSPAQIIAVSKRSTRLRKIVGVLYNPLGPALPKGTLPTEWLPCTYLDASSTLGACKAINVVGDSLDPIARNRQKVLIDKPLDDIQSCPEGELAIIEFRDDQTGSVIKQVFQNDDRWTLVSPNPVDRLAPIVVERSAIRAVWPLRGVLFEAPELDSLSS